MTLNITVTTGRCIYQCADYRLTDTRTGKPCDFETQKIAFVNRYSWSATVCFSGIGRTRDIDVGDWLQERMTLIEFDDPFERLLNELLKADNDWLSDVPVSERKHSFSVGAFVGSKPIFALVSNFEKLAGPPAELASSRLEVFTFRPKKARAFVSGQRHEVARHERRRLEALAVKDPKPDHMYSVLAELNRAVASRNSKVSAACLTTHLSLTGDGGGKMHGTSSRRLDQAFGIPDSVQKLVDAHADKHFGVGQHRVVAFTTVRAGATDDYHETLLRERPLDPNVHSNYGVYLKEKKGDEVGAEREYRRAIELDENHANALGNLANLLWEKGDKEEADHLYRRALNAHPRHENVTWNYARFLLTERSDDNAAREILDLAIEAHPHSGRLCLLRGDVALSGGDASDALSWFRRAREMGADQASVETGYAYALHLANAPVGECIAAYHVAIALNPQLGALRLNLAQLLFTIEDDREAISKLHEAMKLGLDESAQLEAQFYLLLSRTLLDPAAVFRATGSLLRRGARLRWNVQPNIETTRRNDPEKALLLDLVSKVMAGQYDSALLDQILTRWPKETKGG